MTAVPATATAASRAPAARARRRTALALAAPLLSAGGCGEPEVASVWRDRAVVVDGIHGENGESGEWSGALTPLGERKASFGVLNDGEALWVALFVRSPGLQRQILGGGSTVWFDPGGGEDRAFGLRLPADPSLAGPAAGARADRRPSFQESGAGGDRIVEVTAVGVRTGTKAEHERSVEVADAAGFDIAARVVDRVLAIEMRVPLGDPGSAPIALAARPGATITIGIEAQPPPRIGGRLPDRNGEDEDGDFGPPPGGRPPGGGRGNGGGPPGGFERIEPFSQWVKVNLAAGPPAEDAT